MIRKETLFNIFSLILYRLSLDLVYVYAVQPIYSYTDLLNTASINNYIFSWILYLALIPLVLKDFRKFNFSSNVIIILFLTSLVPTTALIAFNSYSYEFIILSFLYWLILLIANRLIPSFKLKFPGGRKYPNILFWSILIVLCLTVLYISGVYTGFRIQFNLTGIYDLRMEEREFNLPLILEYTSSAANFLIPLYLVYFLHKKNFVLVITLSIVIILNFSIGGHKSVFFMFFLSFLGYWFYRFKRIKLFPWALILLTLIGYLQYVRFDDFFIISIFNYRLIFIPSQINYYFFDFFSNNEIDYFRQGILRWLGFESPYKESINFIIGDEYFGSDIVRANNGLFSDAYMNLGTLGVFIFPFIIISIIRLIDATAKELDEKFVFIPIIITSLSLLSTTFSTALLTSGLIIMMITLYLLPREAKIDTNFTK